MAKQTYLAPTAIAIALAAAGPKGVRIALFPAKDGDKAKFSGSVDITTVDGITTEVVGVKCYATKADGTPLLDKNQKPYLQMMYGNNKDEGYLFGNMFSNTKREGKKDADFTISINLGPDNRVDGKVWVSVPKAGGDKYLSGNLGSKAENAPAEAHEAPATTKTTATEPDPFNL